MARPTNLRRMGISLAAPVLLSLAVHGLLLLVLWLCPAHGRSPALAIETTRVALDACLLDIVPPAKGESDLPPEARGPDVSTAFTPSLLDAPAAPSESIPSAAPVLHGGPLDHGEGATAPPAGGGTAEGGGGASLFPLAAPAGSVVYVLDRSVSMGMDDKLDLARREILAGLRRLSPSVRFQVVAYNTYAENLLINGQRDLLPAEPAIVAQAASVLARLAPSGDTDHANALRRGLMLRPDVLFLVTDADDLTAEQVDAITRCNRGTAIHAVELSPRRQPRPDGPLARLARDNGGSYRRVCPRAPLAAAR